MNNVNNKTYYDWLEVSPRASKEVIEKAYKALVIKYHPDLQDNNKADAEEMLKKINEAYDVLSDKDKRAKYDATLPQDNYTNNSVSKDDYDKLKQELNRLKNTQTANVNYTNPTQVKTNNSELEYKKQLEQQLAKQREQQKQAELEYRRQVEAAKQKAYHDAYIQDLRNRGYKIRYKKSFKDYVRLAITALVLIALAWLAWQIPFTRNWIIDSCNKNPLLKLFLGIIYPLK